LEEQVFDIVGHFNHSIKLLNNQVERLKIAQLNLIAGQKAKMATAYGAAINYLTVGRECLTHWESEYDLTLNLFTEATEATYLNGDFKQMEQLAQIVLQQARTLSDEVKVCEIQIRAYAAQNQQHHAIKTALMFLKRLGISLAEDATQEEVEFAIHKMQVSLSGKPIQSLIDLPMMTDTSMKMAMRVMVAVSAVAYSVSPRLTFLLVLKQVELSLTYGNVSESSFSYTTYGGILCGIVGDIESGYQFGQLGSDLLKRLDEKKFKTKVIQMFNTFIRKWKEHARETLQSLLENYQTGLETGDIEYAAYSLFVYSYSSYFVGKQLVTLEQEMARNSHAIVRLKQEIILNWGYLYWQVVLNLMGRSNNPYSLEGEIYDENIQLPLHQQANDGTAIHSLHLNKCILCYLFQKYAAAIENAEIAERHLESVTGVFKVPIFHFYDSLARLALYPSLSQPEQDAVLTKVSANQEKMKQWAHHAPMNYLHKFYLVEAERSRVLGKDGDAREFYDKAIELAHENEYLNEEALAYELAGQFYLVKGKPKVAQVYLHDAHYAYQQWGATAKVKHLETKYPQFLVSKTASAIPTDTTISATGVNSISTRSQLLDLNSVMKAAQTLSGEIVLSHLLEKMMHIVIENAGAEKGFLLLPKQDSWFIEAEGFMDNSETTVLQSLPIAESERMSANIIHYVARTKENVVLHDATQKGNFTRDTYIVKHCPKSVLCFPLVNQGQLTGILYLENNLTTGAFTANRLETLNLLSSQIAISIENSLLYNNLEEKVAERTQELSDALDHLKTTQAQLVESEKMASLGGLVAGIAHEINTPIGIGLMSASTLTIKTEVAINAFKNNKLKKSTMGAYFDKVAHGSQLILRNLERASELVKSFKQVAVDQSNLEKRSFVVKKYLEEILIALKPKLQKTHQITLNGDEEIEINSYPGALSQIITNLLTNSSIHAYQEGEEGQLRFDIRRSEEQVIIEYSDDGCGIPTESLPKIFDPFFTTGRIKGGTGLGLHITYNLVTQKLKGTIQVESVVNVGTTFIITLPLTQ
jgi:signal transduction histidine kinase